MYHHSFFSFRHVLVCSAALAGLAVQAQPATTVGQVSQLSGVVTTQPADHRKFRILAVRSVVSAGDTLRAESDTYVRISLPEGRLATLGPNARVTFKAPDTLELHSGLLEVRAAEGSQGSLSVVAGSSVIDASKGSAVMQLVPEVEKVSLLRQRAYSQAAIASVGVSTASDAAPSRPIWDVVATAFVAQYVDAGTPSNRPPLSGTSPGLPAGLYVSVIDGAILMSNRGGSQSFTAGQFGYTANFSQPPVVMPANPGMKFTPPPLFSATSIPPGNSGTAPKSQVVDCEVR